MSDFKFNCPACGQHLQGDDLYHGKQVTCPTCKTLFLVPGTAVSPPRAWRDEPRHAPPPNPQRPVPPKKSNSVLKYALGGLVFIISFALVFLAVSALLSRSKSNSLQTSGVTTSPANSPAQTSAAADSRHPTASEIVQNVSAKYEALTSYSATATGLMQMDMSRVDPKKLPGADQVPKNSAAAKQLKDTLSKPIQTEVSFTIKMARPSLYKVEWQSSGATASKGAVWSSGDGDFLCMLKNKYTKMQTRELALTTAAGASGGVAATVPMIFFEPSSQLSIFNTTSRGDDDSVDGEDCYVLNADAMGVKTVLWIAKDSFLIKQRQMIFGSAKSTMPKATDAQIDEQLKNMDSLTPAQKEQAKKAAKNMGPMLSQMRGSLTETYSDIQTSPILSKTDFDCNLPPGATLSSTLF